MNRRIYTKEQFETADGGYILQNFLGARWTSSVISSNQAQHLFGATMDVSLASGLKVIRNLLGAKDGIPECSDSLQPAKSRRLNFNFFKP